MNPWQMAQQIKHVLATVKWEKDATPSQGPQVVFGERGVHVFAGTPTEEQIPAGFPWCLVSIDGGDVDPYDSSLLTQHYTILTAAEVAGDPLGEFSIIGGSASSLGKSVGRGVAEVDERVRAAVGDLKGSDGAKISLALFSMGTPTPIGHGGRHMVLSEHTLRARCTSSLNYAAPQELKYQVAGNHWSWEGSHCSDRYDFRQYRLFESENIMTVPTTAQGQIEKYKGTAAQVPGIFRDTEKFYTVFADYSSRGQTGVIEGSNTSEVGSYVAKDSST